MQRRPLGRSGIQIAPLMLGGNVFGWTANEADSFSILDAFVATGFNAIDTADVYSVWIPGHRGGESETVIGNWLKRGGRRQQVVIATKVGMAMSPDKKGLARNYILQSVEDSLQRLQTDYIDVYFAHQDDPSVPLEESLSTFAELIKQGKVRSIGASNYTGARLKEALAVSAKLGLPRYECLQPHYNLYERAGYETDLEPLCTQEQLGVVSYFALARGFLSGKYRSLADLGKSARGPQVKDYLNPRGLRIIDALEAVGRRCQATPAQVAIAWVMQHPSITAPIASATTVSQVRDMLAAANVKLNPEDLQLLDKASAAE